MFSTAEYDRSSGGQGRICPILRHFLVALRGKVMRPAGANQHAVLYGRAAKKVSRPEAESGGLQLNFPHREPVVPHADISPGGC